MTTPDLDRLSLTKTKQFFRQCESTTRTMRLMLNITEHRLSSGIEPAAYVDNDTWSIAEDKLLCKAEELKADVVSMYAAKHKDNPNQYPKTLTDLMAKARLLELKSSSVAMQRRMKLIRVMPDDEGVVSSGTAPAAAVSAFSSSPALAASSNKEKRGGGFGDLTSPLGGREDAVLRCRCRGHEAEEVLCNSSSVTSHSPFLSDLFKLQAHSDDSVMGLRAVELFETNDMWANIPAMNRVFGTDNVMRYVQFCREPQAIEQKIALEERLAELKEAQQKDWKATFKSLEENKEKTLKTIDQRCGEEEKNIREEYQKSLEEDISTLRDIYAAHVESEVAALQYVQRRRRDATETFFDNEVAMLDSLAEVVEIPEVVQLSKEVEKYNEMIEEIYPKDGIARLLMLADVLRSSELKSLCAKEIARNIPEYLNDDQLGSDLIRETTVKELLANVSPEDLWALMKHKIRGGLPLELIKEEWAERQSGFESEIEQLSNDELTEMWRTMPTDSIWRGTLFAVYDRRQRAMKGGAAGHIPGGSSVSRRHGSSQHATVIKAHQRFTERSQETDCLEVSTPFKYITVESQRAVRIGEGIYKAYWEVKLHYLGRGGTVAVGFEPADRLEPSKSARFHWTDREPLVGTAPSASGLYGCGLSNDGVLYHNGGADDGRVNFVTNDVIGVGIDQLNGHVTFFKNGILIPFPRHVTCHLIPKKQYLPSVTLYCPTPPLPQTGSIAVSERLRVSIELEHNFVHALPAGHKPFFLVSSTSLPQEQQQQTSPGGQSQS